MAEVRANARIELEHPAELKLGKTICRLPEVLYKVEEDFFFHKLCEFLYELSCAYTEFYDNCYCIEQENGECLLL